MTKAHHRRTPRERLLDAAERLSDDVSTGLLSHHDLHCCDHPDGPGPVVTQGHPDTAITAFKVATDTACTPAATGQPGEVVVSVPVANYPVPLNPLLLHHLVAGDLKVADYDAHQPPVIAAGDAHVNIQLAPTQPTGLYVGHLHDAAGVVISPVVIYLDGLP